ncbi:MAG: hypothetical protein HYZ53_18500 [Planctomycetes bacterium]|nr:hypothetical protein [Planctomycetota bacterium]
MSQCPSLHRSHSGPTAAAVLVSLLCLTAGGAQASAQSPDLAGAWAVSGRHPTSGPYSGTATLQPLTPAPGRFAIEWAVTFERTGASASWSGDGAFAGNTLTTTTASGGPGAVDRLSGAFGSAATVKGKYELRAGGRLWGAWWTEGGGASARGTETLTRMTTQEFLVSAPDLAGRATVRLLGPSPSTPGASRAEVSLEARAFGRGGGTRSLSGSGTFDPERGRLEWRPASAPGGGAAAAACVLTRAADGRYSGTVDGLAQTWVADRGTQAFTVLVVPGLSTNSWNRIGIPYLDENIAALEALGLSARRLTIQTEASIARNAAFIQREIRAEAAAGRRVLLFAHSKGGSDSTAACALDPGVAAAVSGMVAIQPVYGGSPVADFARSQPLLLGPIRLVFERIFKGQKEAVFDLASASRRAFVAAHPYPSNRIPTVVIRSSFDRRISRSVLWPSQKLIKRYLGEASDGLVIPKDQSIPGAAVTFDYADLDHFEPGLRGESPHRPVDLTTRSILALLEKVWASGN